jgi:hypothetical protein
MIGRITIKDDPVVPILNRRDETRSIRLVLPDIFLEDEDQFVEWYPDNTINVSGSGDSTYQKISAIVSFDESGSNDILKIDFEDGKTLDEGEEIYINGIKIQTIGTTPVEVEDAYQRLGLTLNNNHMSSDDEIDINLNYSVQNSSSEYNPATFYIGQVEMESDEPNIILKEDESENPTLKDITIIDKSLDKIIDKSSSSAIY